MVFGPVLVDQETVTKTPFLGYNITMKTTVSFLGLVCLTALLTVAAIAQTNTVPGTEGIPADLLNKPIREWQLNATTGALAVMMLGRIFTAIKNGGGLRGIIGALWGGTNAPKPTDT